MPEWTYTGASNPQEVEIWSALGRYYLADNNGDIHQIGDAGGEIWVTSDPNGAGVAPKQLDSSGDYLYALYDNTVIVLNGISGSIRHSFPVNGAIPRDIVGGSGGDVCWVVEDESVVYYDATDGSTINTYTEVGRQFTTIIPGNGLVIGTDDGKVINISEDLNSVLGSDQTYPTDVAITVADNQGNYYFAGENNIVTSISNIGNFFSPWSSDAGETVNALSFDSPYVQVATPSGATLLDDNNDGAIVSTLDAPGAGTDVTPSADFFEGGGVYSIENNYVAGYGDDEFTAPPEKITATQTSVAATVNGGTLSALSLSAVTVTSNAQTTTGIVSISQPVDSVSSTASANTAEALQVGAAESTPISATASQNDASVSAVSVNADVATTASTANVARIPAYDISADSVSAVGISNTTDVINVGVASATPVSATSTSTTGITSISQPADSVSSTTSVNSAELASYTVSADSVSSVSSVNTVGVSARVGVEATQVGATALQNETVEFISTPAKSVGVESVVNGGTVSNLSLSSQSVSAESVTNDGVLSNFNLSANNVSVDSQPNTTTVWFESLVDATQVSVTALQNDTSQFITLSAEQGAVSAAVNTSELTGFDLLADSTSVISESNETVVAEILFVNATQPPVSVEMNTTIVPILRATGFGDETSVTLNKSENSVE